LQQDSETPLAHHPSEVVLRFVGRTSAALLLLLLTIYLMIGVLSLPWLDYSESSTKYYLGGFCNYTGCHDYGDIAAPLRNVFPLTHGLVLTALALSMLELVFLVLFVFGKTGGNAILLTGILGSIALLVATVYFYFGLLVEMSHEPWSAGTGWFMAIVALASFLVETIMAFSSARHFTPSGKMRASAS